MNQKPRTRFAPSPTGYMHIGNLRTALYCYLVAKKENGTFILRIEDTDQARKVEGAVDIIYQTLSQCGLKHDEGPDVGGNYGSYVQSERMASGIYKKYALELVEKDKAHICFCNQEDIASQKEVMEAKGESFIYNDPCKKLDKETIKTRMQNEEYVVRQTIDTNGSTTFHDEVYGDITVENSILDEMILLKSDGFPTYNFANVIDDHMMEITHVVRGNEYLSSTPKYNLLYEAFGWQIPKYIHCPPVMKDEHSKLSKRNGDASFQDLIQKGYLSSAIMNYIALLGWSPSEDREIYSLDELIQAFDVHNIGKNGAIFDIEKLKWMNGMYIRALDFDKYYELILPFIKEKVDPKYDYVKIAKVLKERISVLNDALEQIDFFNEIDKEYDLNQFENKKAKTDLDISLNSLKQALSVLESIDEKDFTNDITFEKLANKALEINIKNITLMYPLQVALSGKSKTPGGATALFEILNKQESLNRIKFAINRLENR